MEFNGFLDFYRCIQTKKVYEEVAESLIAIAERTDIGITFSDIILAESGTVTLFNDKIMDVQLVYYPGVISQLSLGVQLFRA